MDMLSVEAKSIRRILRTFLSRTQNEGVGATVTRSIGSKQLPDLDPFFLLDEFYVELPGGFPDHPHRGFETVTYLLPTSDGNIRHEDFLGNKGVLSAGDLQWMSPGKGIIHAEMPASEKPAHGLQLWINLPREQKMMDPFYQYVQRSEVVQSWSEDKSVEALVFAGNAFGTKGPISTRAEVTFIHFMLKRGAQLQHAIPAAHNAFMYVLEGKGACDGRIITAHEAVVFDKEGQYLSVSSSDNNSMQFVLITGKPLNEPIARHGPFVMCTEAEIWQTMSDLHYKQNGFENATGWKSEIGNS